jgi:hypothetical protein
MAHSGHMSWRASVSMPTGALAVRSGYASLSDRRAQRGWVVLKDTMYAVRGPDGERQVCRPCVERCGFRRHDENEDWESPHS